jgi:hypothetical protein
MKYSVNIVRLALAVCFSLEMGQYFGWDHFKDRSPEEVLCTGIGMLLLSLSVSLSVNATTKVKAK